MVINKIIICQKYYYQILVIGAIYTKSRSGNPMIQIGGYKFRKWSGSRGPRARWICNSDNKGCRSKIWTVDDEIIYYNNNHNHV